MGYDSKVYVVKKDSYKEGGKRWRDIVATLDMCVFDGFKGIFIKCKKHR